LELVISNLSKSYPNGVRALDNVSLTIPTGMFGLLGPNGAGKSTLMRTIATLQEPDRGTIRFGNIDVVKDKDAVRRVLGYLPQEFGFYPNLSAEATLDHFATLKGMTDRRGRRETVLALLQQTNLYDVRRKNVGGFSGGMKQRLGIAVALIGQPQILIVDEPTAGLDPTERNRFLNLLAEVGENIVVILSTHIVEDVRELCSNVAILTQGRVATVGAPDQVIEALEGKIWKRTLEKSQLGAAQAQYHIVSTRLIAGKPVIYVYSDVCPDMEFTPVAADLADVYFYHTSLRPQIVAGAMDLPLLSYPPRG
jgi:ABC-type multidrug transport system ATPase subunit